MEALAWARQSAAGDIRVIHEFSPRKSMRIINKLYSLGAKTVEAADIQEKFGGQATSTLIVLLPESPAARRKLFRFSTVQAWSSGFCGSSDQGQKLEMLWWT